MKLNVQKRIAGKLLKCSPKKVKLDASRSEEIKEAITKRDIRGLLKGGVITKRRTQEISRSRARKIHRQKRRGQRKGPGSRKGGVNSRVSKKERWMQKIRAQRSLLKELREGGKITQETYRELYTKSKGGYFRSRRHITLYMEEHQLVKQ